MDASRSVNLDDLARELLADAAMQSALRAAHTLPHPVDGLRQTVIALISGQELAEHESPGPASLLVLRGTVRLVSDEQTDTLGAQQICPIPNRRHSLHADEDSVVLLSVAVPQRAPADAR
jgi:quercetin dioxygenase-like cupin family protein